MEASHSNAVAGAAVTFTKFESTLDICKSAIAYLNKIVPSPGSFSKGTENIGGNILKESATKGDKALKTAFIVGSVGSLGALPILCVIGKPLFKALGPAKEAKEAAAAPTATGMVKDKIQTIKNQIENEKQLLKGATGAEKEELENSVTKLEIDLGKTLESKISTNKESLRSMRRDSSKPGFVEKLVTRLTRENQEFTVELNELKQSNPAVEEELEKQKTMAADQNVPEPSVENVPEHPELSASQPQATSKPESQSALKDKPISVANPDVSQANEKVNRLNNFMKNLIDQHSNSADKSGAEITKLLDVTEKFIRNVGNTPGNLTFINSNAPLKESYDVLLNKYDVALGETWEDEEVISHSAERSEEVKIDSTGQNEKPVTASAVESAEDVALRKNLEKQNEAFKGLIEAESKLNPHERGIFKGRMKKVSESVAENNNNRLSAEVMVTITTGHVEDLTKRMEAAYKLREIGGVIESPTYLNRVNDKVNEAWHINLDEKAAYTTTRDFLSIDRHALDELNQNLQTRLNMFNQGKEKILNQLAGEGVIKPETLREDMRKLESSVTRIRDQREELTGKIKEFETKVKDAELEKARAAEQKSELAQKKAEQRRDLQDLEDMKNQFGNK